MQKEGISKPVSFKCFNCNHQEIAWKDETGMIRFVCPHCGTITISKEKSRRHTFRTTVLRRILKKARSD